MLWAVAFPYRAEYLGEAEEICGADRLVQEQRRPAGRGCSGAWGKGERGGLQSCRGTDRKAELWF